MQEDTLKFRSHSGTPLEKSTACRNVNLMSPIEVYSCEIDFAQFEFQAFSTLAHRTRVKQFTASHTPLGPNLGPIFGKIMGNLEKRRAEAIKAYWESQAEACERAEREQQGRDKWLETSGLIVAGVKRASDNFAREGSPFVIAHLPGAYPTNLFHSRARETHREYFEIHPIENLPDPTNPLRACFGHLEFKLTDDGRILVKHDWSPNVPEAIDFDEITESLAEAIASEVLIRVLGYD
jgi:hypothetical protein